MLQIFNETKEDIPLSQAQADAIIAQISAKENATFTLVEVVFVDEKEIVRINKEHLGRNYITDIISFRYDDEAEKPAEDNLAIEGTLFCCAPRIKEQAGEFGQAIDVEFRRILIHGLLHLIGYEDSTEEEKSAMTALEDFYLKRSSTNK
jgi:rRNA maturation RNase YbeY